jgi:hypothetical protein
MLSAKLAAVLGPPQHRRIHLLQCLQLCYMVVSAALVSTPQAQDAILTAMITDSSYARAISMTAAKQAGAAIVTTAEVKEAICALPVRRSPGADGLQLELWCLADLAWAPVLARLFNAILVRRVPPADGHITPG